MSKKKKDVAGAERPAEQPAAKAAATASQDAKRRPIKHFRVDDVSAAVWDRKVLVQGEERVYYSVTFERSYKDRDGTWKHTRWFDLESLGKVVTVAQQAVAYSYRYAEYYSAALLYYVAMVLVLMIVQKNIERRLSWVQN